MRKYAVMGLGVVVLAGCGTGTTSSYESPPTTMSAETIDEIAIDLAWDGMDPSDRTAICEGIEMFGVDVAVQMVLDGYPEGNPAVVREKFTEECV
jgi:hypothetical protein